MKLLSDQRFLAFYSGGLTVALVMVLCGAASKAKTTRFEVVEAQRINIVEPDGTLRMALFSEARVPGLVIRGKEHPHPTRKTAGMLFYNEEGTENGGLVFGGRRGDDGKVGSGGSLTFDQYEQDQVVQVTQQEFDGKRMAGVVVNDRPDGPMDMEAFARATALPAGPEKDAAMQALSEHGFGVKERVFIGKHRDRSSAIELSDTQGRNRLVLQVAPDGAPSLVFLDADGKELDRFPRPKGG